MGLVAFWVQSAGDWLRHVDQIIDVGEETDQLREKVETYDFPKNQSILVKMHKGTKECRPVHQF